MKQAVKNKIETIHELWIYYWARLERYFDYRKYKKKKLTNSVTDRIVLFDTCGLKINRRLAQIVLQFKNAGYNCLLRITRKEFVMTSRDDYSDFVFNNTFPLRDEKYSVIVCGKNNTDHSCKRIVLDDNIDAFPQHLNSQFFFPISMHPVKMLSKAESYIDSISGNPRRIGAVFIGNTEINQYSNRIAHDKYGMHTRIETLNYIATSLPPYVFRPNNLDEFNKAFFDTSFPLKNKIVIIDKPFIRDNDYLSVLSSSMFHIWTFGDLLPYCHNQIEGMACGAIPICEKYQEKPLYPGMKDRFNCFCYEKLEELIAIIKSINTRGIIDGGQWIEGMRLNVKNLYDINFSLNAFSNRVDSFVDSQVIESTYFIIPSIYKE